MKLKILSWNIWYYGNLDKVNDYLEKSGADIIGLQEVMSVDNEVNSSKRLIDAFGYKYVYAPVFPIEKNGKQVLIGNAIFSKPQILKSRTYNLSKADNRVALEVAVKIADQTLKVFTTHLIHTHQKPSLLQEEQASSLIKALPVENVILMGDFNATTESSAIKKISKVLTNTDKSNKPTWSVYDVGCKICRPKLEYKLDHIFVSRNVKFDSCAVGKSAASDHLPISVELDI